MKTSGGMHVTPRGISQCPNPAPYRPIDRSRRHFCRTPQRSYSVKNPFCGCPWQSDVERCYRCIRPDTVQVRILYPPRKCVKEPCPFTIPPVPCQQTPNPRRIQMPCRIDWHVDEPGPNDSYGLNGLNWFDWQMEYHNREADIDPTRQGLSLMPPPKDFPSLVCQLPIECYTRSPDAIKCSPFPGPVNYTRDWRCCQALPPKPWKPAFA